MSTDLPVRPSPTPAASSKPPSSTAPPAAKPPCTLHPTAVIADKASLTGTHEIHIGANSVIQPYAKIKAEGGKVVIGANCTIAEAAVVGHADGKSTGDVVLGDGVSVESGAKVTAALIGDASEIGIHASIGEGAVLGKYCKIAPKLAVAPGEHLGDYTVIFGDNRRRRDETTASNGEVRDARNKGQERHVEALRKLIPNAAVKWTT